MLLQHLTPPFPQLKKLPWIIYASNRLNYFLVDEVIAGSGALYKGKFYPFKFQPVTVVFKVTNLGEVEELTESFNRNRQVATSWIVPVTDEFTDDNRKLWHVFPFVGKSIRSLCPNGASESLIAGSLETILNSLNKIHKKELVHGQINSGHVYHSFQDSMFKLGFGVTCYEDTVEVESDYLPANKIAEWASPPEVFYNESPCSKMGDIWQVGITAIEMSMGKILVRNRTELNFVVNWITDSGQTGAFFVSDELRDLIRSCLQQNPSNRPTPGELLRYPFFHNN